MTLLFLMSTLLTWDASANKSMGKPILVTALPDGISISGSEPLRQIVASWDIYVTLEPPPFPTDLARRVEDIDTLLNSIMQLQTVGVNIDLQPFKLRRDRLRQILRPRERQHSRVRRGLLDIGGTLLHHLFGVATDSQLVRFRAAMEELKGRQDDIAHAYGNLATVVNQTRAYVRQLALQQQHLHGQVVRLDTAILALSRAVQANSRKLHRVALMTDLDRYFDVLDLAAQHYLDQVTLFNRQRSGLERAHLTRALLPEDQLEEILQKAAAQHKVVDALAWYYQFITVSPLWRKSDSLLYKIELPLMAPRPYLLYNLMSHPVPLNGSDYSVIVKLEHSYALDTVSGNLFVPHKCIGHGPTLCLTGPEFGPSRMQCARGLLTNRPDLVNSCRVNLQHLDTDPIVSTIDLNQYAIATHGTSLSVRCPGVPELQVSLSRGTYNVTCLRPCTLAGEGFTITCVDRLYLSKRFAMPVVRVTTHFNFSTTVHIDAVESVVPQVRSVNTQPLLDLPVDTLLHPVSPIKFTPPPVSSTPSLLTIINLICLAIFVGVLSLFYMRWRCRHHRRQPSAPVEEHLPLSTVNDCHTERDINLSSATSTRIWPTLPSPLDCGMQSVSENCSPA